MNYKINVFLYICKIKNEIKIKKDIIKKIIPTKNKSNKNIIVKYLLYNRRNKSYIIKRKWKINYILNKTKKKKKKERKNYIGESDSIKKFYDREDIISKKNDLTKNLLNTNKSRENISTSYNHLLNKINRNIKNYTNTTIINTGVDTHENEKNVFLYGSLFIKYLNKCNEKKKEEIKKTSKYFKTSKMKYEEIISENKTKNKKECYNNFKSSCDIKENYYEYKDNVEEYSKKKGLIYDIYDYIIKMNYENIKISISSWVYRNYKIIDILKKKYQKKKKIKNKKESFCYKCFINKFFNNSNLKYTKCCNNLPFRKTIKNYKNLKSILKYIIRKYVKIINNIREKTNVCFLFKYKFMINNRNIFLYFINFPLCNIEKNKIFYNINNEKSLLFLFNKKIVNSLKDINDYSNFLFPFSNSKKCQKVINLKKKIIYFVKNKKYSFKDNKNVKKEIFINNSLSNHRKHKFASDNDINIRKKNNTKCDFTKYNKKDMIFHVLIFELLIRLIFENSKTYFTIFISDITNDYDFYKNIYYLNLSKIINICVKLKNTTKKKKIKSKSLLSQKNLLDNLLKENDKFKNKIEGKDKIILQLENEINEKNKIVSELENEIQKNKDENLDKIKIIENLKKKISKKETLKTENTDEYSQKNNNYLKKLYNENNLLKEKIKKLNNLIKKEETFLKTTDKLCEKNDNSESMLLRRLDNNNENENDKLNFFFKAFVDTEQKLYIADIVIKTQKEIITKIKKDKNYYFEELQKKKIIFKKELENSLDFIYSVCEDIKTKKEKICLKNRINKLQDCINTFLNELEKNY
ncbi:conserved Plasmodium protein, unknown function [Plasmodium gallinaceum]|uniref:Uncharacterized protein n=1 Tax=Plasmodium gallinaceum TaxID=5849 RepID=A0A1J1GYZ3_PLAGA|nr:conserved Plasmodium protein, unknown function [Plasmodium gallinaceum]CRG97803.1 conserved Plasmodium protein, unknown function [Plasmodium gallinaceum]